MVLSDRCMISEGVTEHKIPNQEVKKLGLAPVGHLLHRLSNKDSMDFCFVDKEN